MDELSHFTGAVELTVNIRGNDIDFKVLWLQMSLVLSFSFSLLRKKKIRSPRFDLHFSFLSFPVARAGKMETVRYLAPGGHPTPQLFMEQSDRCGSPIPCVPSVSCRTRKTCPEHLFPPSPTLPQLRNALQPPPTPGWDNHSLEAARPCPQLLPAISLPSPCLCPSSFSPLTPLTMLLPSCPPVPSALALSSQVTPPPGSPLAT